jgi:hypothetical protein
MGIQYRYTGEIAGQPESVLLHQNECELIIKVNPNRFLLQQPSFASKGTWDSLTKP